MARLARDYSLHREFYGPTSSAVFALVQEGWSIRDAASRVHAALGWSGSNGSVSRGPPIGVFFSGPEVESVSYGCSALTHADPVPAACSAFVNRMVSDMCRGIPRAAASRPGPPQVPGRRSRPRARALEFLHSRPRPRCPRGDTCRPCRLHGHQYVLRLHLCCDWSRRRH